MLHGAEDANEVVGDEVHEQFLFDHSVALAALLLKSSYCDISNESTM